MTLSGLLRFLRSARDCASRLSWYNSPPPLAEHAEFVRMGESDREFRRASASTRVEARKMTDRLGRLGAEIAKTEAALRR